MPNSLAMSELDFTYKESIYPISMKDLRYCVYANLALPAQKWYKANGQTERHGMSNVLRNARNTAMASIIVLTTAFGAQAQNDNTLASNVKSKTETTVSSKPTIIHSGSWEAQNYSIDNKALVIHIATGNKETMYTAEEYATMLSAMFLDPERTQNPIKVIFFIEKRDADFTAKCRTYINGHRFDKNGGQLNEGDDFIHPYDLPGHIPTITQKYAATKSKPNTASVGYTHD